MLNDHSKPPCAVILTALPVEYEAVRAYLKDLREKVHEGTIYELGHFQSGDRSWDVAIAEIGMGNPGAASAAERAIAYFKPRLVLFVGVAGGLKDVQLGDVVAVDRVYGYEFGKVDTTGFKPRPNVYNATYALEQRARAVARRQDWMKRLPLPLPDRTPNALVGPIAAGEKVLASTTSETWNLIKQSYGSALAVEMEGHGFLAALHANQHVEALIVRGISDLIDGKQEADAASYQEVAARHASAFAFEVLAKLGGDEAFRSSLSRIRSTEKIKRSDLSKPSKRDQFQNCGPIQGSIQGGSNNTIHNVIMNTPSRDDVAGGRAYVKRGRAALSYGDYTAARQHLETAASLLYEDQLPQESAQVKYLLALALLGGQRPFGVTLQAWRRVEELMQAAVTLHPCYSYLYTFALFKQDFARNGWRRSQYIQDTQDLIEEANHAPSSHEDNENLNLLWHCQPLLMQEAQ